MMSKTPSFARISAGVAATLLSLSLAAPALAQSAKPAPKPAPQAAPAQAQGAQQGQGAAAEPKYSASPWQKICQEEPTQKKKLCVLSQILGIEDQVMAKVDLVELEGEPKKTMQITARLGMRLAPGMRLTLDKDTVSIPFTICIPMQGGGGACIGEQEIDAAFITKFRKANAIYLQMQHGSGRIITQPMSNADFGKAYDSPGKDVKVAEEEARKLAQQEQEAKAAKEAKDSAALLKHGQQRAEEQKAKGQ